MRLFEISEYSNIESLWINNQIETLNLDYKSQISANEVAKDNHLLQMQRVDEEIICCILSEFCPLSIPELDMARPRSSLIP